LVNFLYIHLLLLLAHVFATVKHVFIYSCLSFIYIGGDGEGGFFWEGGRGGVRDLYIVMDMEELREGKWENGNR